MLTKIGSGTWRYRLVAALLFTVCGFGSTCRSETITAWSCSQSFPAARVSPDTYPRFYAVFLAGWQDVAAQADGWLDLAGDRSAGDSLCVLARPSPRPRPRGPCAST